MATRYEYYNPTPTAELPWGPAYGVNWKGQTFTPSTAHTITSVKLLLYRVGSPGTYTIGIRATSSGLPTGGNLCSGSIDGDTLTDNPAGEEKEITLGAGANLSASVQYAIVMDARDGSAGNSVQSRGRSTDASYAGGTRCYSANSGVAWTAVAADDHWFEEWGESLAFEESVTDGLSMGDTRTGQAIFQANVIDGLRGGDTSPSQLTVFNSLADSLLMGDITQGFRAFYRELSDGVSLGDALAHLYEANPSILDGLEAGDAPSTLASLFNALVDGAKLGDTPQARLGLFETLIDGLGAGDSLAAQQAFQVLIADGIKLEDILIIGLVYEVAVADGARLGDITTASIAKALARMILALRNRNLVVELPSRDITLQIGE